MDKRSNEETVMMGNSSGASYKYQDAEALAKAYNPAYRKVEVASMFAFALLAATCIFKVVTHALEARHWMWAGWGLLVGWIASDFTSGFVHWAGDTWGSVDWPILGNSLIRPFREHHVDQLAITRHDLVEASGSHCLISLPVLAMATLIPMRPESGLPFFLVSAAYSLTVMTFWTAPIHAWAHRAENPWWIRKLQQLHVILPPDHHDVHHQHPHMHHYCITSGWMNGILDKTGFFRRMETLISGLTGARPREDELAG